MLSLSVFSASSVAKKFSVPFVENNYVSLLLECGEKFLKPEVAKQIDHFLLKENKPDKTINVPVYEYLQATV